MKKTHYNQVTYRPSKEAWEFLERFAGEGSRLTKPQVLDIIIDFFRHWSDESVREVIALSTNPNWLMSFSNSIAEIAMHELAHGHFGTGVPAPKPKAQPKVPERK